jgi:PPK2 family polyphosphate:nucleotide phosphotransferase
MNHEHFIVPPGKKIRLKDYNPAYTGKFRNKTEALEKLQKDVLRLAKLQDAFYAQDTQALLIIFQAMDAAGKDGTIRHVMSGINPQGCQVYNFKQPSAEELDHDFLWRSLKVVPERGRIGIFNRSYYEEVLVVRVHPELLDKQKLPPEARTRRIWKHRFEDINCVERYLVRNGIHILKFFLNVSKEEQRRRFLARIDTPEKNWKFSASDVKERAYWDDYMNAYEDVFNYTSTEYAPWYILPADNKWFTRAAVADVIIKKLKSLKPRYPEVSEAHKRELHKAKEMLIAEDKKQRAVKDKAAQNGEVKETEAAVEIPLVEVTT